MLSGAHGKPYNSRNTHSVHVTCTSCKYYNPYIRRAGTLTPGLTTNRKCLHVQYIEGRKPYFTTTCASTSKDLRDCYNANFQGHGQNSGEVIRKYNAPIPTMRSQLRCAGNQDAGSWTTVGPRVNTRVRTHARVSRGVQGLMHAHRYRGRHRCRCRYKCRSWYLWSPLSLSVPSPS